MSNKVALITGGASGLGKAIARFLASKQINVIINYNTSKNSAIALKEELEKSYQVKVLLVKCDISKEDEVNNMIEEIKDNFSHIDYLVNNAAICLDSLYVDKTKENFMKTLEINLVGTFLVSKYVSKIMLKNKYGRIINISSTNGIDKYFPMCLDYDASKAGVISLTHNLALELKPYIHANCIAPGWIGTENELKDVDAEFIKSEEELLSGDFARVKITKALEYDLIGELE